MVAPEQFDSGWLPSVSAGEQRMALGQATTQCVTREEFEKAVGCWPQGAVNPFIDHWLRPECTLLSYLRERFVANAPLVAKEATLLKAMLENPGHSQILEQYRPMAARAVSQHRALVHGVLAAQELQQYLLDRTDTKLAAFQSAAIDCINGFQEACPFVAEPLVGPNCYAASGDTKLSQALHGLYRHPGVTTFGFLACRRLLEYLLGDLLESSPPKFETSANVLLYDAFRDQGSAHRVTIETRQEGASGFYLDPVALGMTVLDDSMIKSLNLAWKLCQDALAQKVALDPAATALAIRLSLDLSLDLKHQGRAYSILEGESAGVVLACGMFAAAHKRHLDPQASASAALDHENPGMLCAVSDESVHPKLNAAEKAGLRRVVLEEKQQKAFPSHRKVKTRPAKTLSEAFALLAKGNHSPRQRVVLWIIFTFIFIFIFIFIIVMPYLGDSDAAGPFRIGEERFESLSAAIAGARDHDIVHVQDAGPFTEEPITIDKPLTIQAMPGVHPVFRLEADAAETSAPLMRSTKNLTLKGLELRRESTQGFQEDQVLLLVEDAELVAEYCRFVLKRKLDCVRLIDAAGRVENCEFISNGGTAVSWTPSSNSKLVMHNCLQVGQSGLHLHYRYGNLQDISATLDHNTFVTPDLLKSGGQPTRTRGVTVKIFVYPTANPASSAISIRATFNVLHSDGHVLEIEPRSGSRKDEADDLLAGLVRWTEEQNLYSVGRPFLTSQLVGSPREFGGIGIETWNAFWMLTDTGSFVATPQFETARLRRARREARPARGVPAARCPATRVVRRRPTGPP